MNKKSMISSCNLVSLFNYLLVINILYGAFHLLQVAQAQTNPVLTNASTDPAEAAILNGMFRRWGISAAPSWNISGELCSGAAIDKTDFQTMNPGIKCDCSNVVCRITGLRVYDLDIPGTIPDELWNLTLINDLDLRLNFFTGPISPAIGRLTGMQYLALGNNALSGQLPTELGRLTELISLVINLPPSVCLPLSQTLSSGNKFRGLGLNNFSGPLPSSFGNFTKLTQTFIDSMGVSGPIPSTFANMRSLQIFRISDNALTGTIPDFIGNMKLRILRLQGNAFEGSIPASFSNLTTVEELMVSDISNGSSSMDFLKNLKSLQRLVLRNNNISGSIPSDIGEYRNLTQLDLSFNNFTGRIPESLFNMSSLVHLFLGNNKLVGGIPSQKSSTLRTIDLSYNELSGGLPSWVSQNTLNLNFVANNFTVGESDSSNLPRGLDCLQRNFPCNRGSPIYSSFAIKCGGLQITSSDNVIYETDNATLGPANYYMTGSGRWAVSNVGLPTDTTSPQYKTLSFAQYGNTIDSELFQTARVSVGSLRYYGLRLENGNYTLNLQFAEGSILNPPRTESTGRRMFDVYIQGNQVLKDFDVRKEAGGVSFRAVQRTFQVQVSENFMEIHFFWAGKGTCCIPSPGTYGPTISAISATPNFVPTVSNIPPSEGKKKNRTGLIVGLVVGVGIVSLFALFVVYYIVREKKRRSAYEDEEFLGMDAKPYTFSYAELRSATNDFNLDNKLGEGGFGPVYKGTLSDGRVVAVKRLSVASNQGKSQFVAEIAAISAVQHRNLVKLYGCCIEGENRLLVYEFLENSSLDKALFGKTGIYLDWPTRFDVCMGIARGLAYLHEESRVKIVHRDVKASNILLDSELNPKISDFGLAKLYDEKMTHISTHVAGTFGYLAPEYAMRGHLTEKADVFSFGVVALEMVSGRPNSDSNLDEDKRFLLEWTWQLHESNRQIELVDEKLQKFNEDEVKRVIGVALMCTQTSLGLRPSMSRVIALLSGDIEVVRVTCKPGYLTGWDFNDTSSLMSNVDSNNDASSAFYSTAPTTTTDNTTSWNYTPVNVSEELILHRGDDEVNPQEYRSGENQSISSGK